MFWLKGFLSTPRASVLCETDSVHALMVETIVIVNLVLKQVFKLSDRIVMTCGNELLAKRKIFYVETTTLNNTFVFVVYY